MDALGRLAHHFHDVVSGLPTLRVFGRARAQRERIGAGDRRLPARHHGHPPAGVPVQLRPRADRHHVGGAGRHRDRAAPRLRPPGPARPACSCSSSPPRPTCRCATSAPSSTPPPTAWPPRERLRHPGGTGAGRPGRLGAAGRGGLRRALMHCIDRNKHRGIADRHGGDAADGRLDMPVPRHVGIVHHDLAAAAQLAAAIGLAFHEAIDDAPAEVGGLRPLRQIETGIADGGKTPLRSSASFITEWPMR